MTALHVQAESVNIESPDRSIENSGEVHINCTAAHTELALLPTGHLSDCGYAALHPSAALAIAHTIIDAYEGGQIDPTLFPRTPTLKALHDLEGT